VQHFDNCHALKRVPLKPNCITLAGSKLVRSWFEAGSKLVADLQRAEIWPIIYQPDFIYLAALRLDKMTMTYK